MWPLGNIYFSEVPEKFDHIILTCNFITISGDEPVGDESGSEGDSNTNDESDLTLDNFPNSDAELNGDL